jgi:hypothetical protein
MGRIVDLFAEVAAEADVGAGGIALPPDVYERLRVDWEEEDIEDALKLVHETLLQGELVESTDSLSSRMVDVLGEFGSQKGFIRAQEGGAVLPIEVIGQLVRRVNRVEEVLEHFRDDPPPDRRGFDELRRRLMNLGIEKEMGLDAEVLPSEADETDEADDEE